MENLWKEESNLSALQVGDIIQTTYNSGTYVVKIIQDKGNYILVETLGVLKHPQQGDLHNPGQAEGVAFHERKALAHHEKFNARKRHAKAFDGEVPAYAASLQQAVESYKQELQQVDTLFNQKALERIADLEEHYYHKIY